MNGKTMREIVAALAGMAMMTCSGCGGGGGSSPSGIIVAEYGDSTTYGSQTMGGILQRTANNEPADLQKILQAQFGQSVTVENHGVGGTQAADLFYGEDGYGNTWPQFLAATHAQIVTINFALNDQLYHADPVTGQPDVDPLQYMGIIAQMVSDARAAGKQVVLYEPNPTKYQPAPGNLASYVYCLRQVAQQMNVPIVAKFDWMQTLPDWRSMLSEDGVHPTDAGYQDIAGQEALTLAPIVQSLMGH